MIEQIGLVFGGALLGVLFIFGWAAIEPDPPQKACPHCGALPGREARSNG